MEGERDKEEKGMALRFLALAGKQLMMLFPDMGKGDAEGNKGCALGTLIHR